MVFALGERLTHHWLAGWRQGDSQRQLIKFITTLNNKPARVVILAGSTNKTPDAPTWLQEIVTVIRNILTDSERTAPETLEAAFQQATERLPQHQKIRVDDASLTLLVAIFQGGYLHLAYLGDNRAYLYRRGELYQLTTDHTKAEELVRAGRIMRIEVRTNPARFVPTRWLGDRKQPLVDRRIRDPYGQNKTETQSTLLQLRTGDRVLICSPEIGNALEDKNIKAALARRANQNAIDRLVTVVQQQTGNLETYAAGVWSYQPGPGQLTRQVVGLLRRLLRRSLQLISGLLGLLLLIALIYVLWQPMCRDTYKVTTLAQKVLSTGTCLTSRSLQPQKVTLVEQLRSLGKALCPLCLRWGGESLLLGSEWVSGISGLVKDSGGCLCLSPSSGVGVETATPTVTSTANHSQSDAATATPHLPLTQTNTPPASLLLQPAVNQPQSVPLPTNTPTATQLPLPPVPATPAATATLPGTTVITSEEVIAPSLPLTLAIELAAPGPDVVELRGDVTFAWQAASAPPSGYAYQTIFWPTDKMPANGFGIHELIYDQVFNRTIPLVTLDEELAPTLLIPNKTYQWSVCLYNLMTRSIMNLCSNDQRTVVYKRER